MNYSYQNVAQALLAAYRETPDQIAIRLLYSQQDEQIVTYRDLCQGAAGYAAALRESGIKSDEVVILVLNHGIDLVYAFFGAILHGAIPSIMPFLTEKLSPDHYRAALASLFEITAPSAAVTYPEFVDELRQASANTSVRAVLVSGSLPACSVADLENLPGEARAGQDIVLLQHSSGTTGLQKGVALSHQAVFNQLTSYSRAIHLQETDVIVSWLPLYHDMGLIAGFLLPILGRIPLVLMSPFDWVRAPYRLFQAISHYRGTLCWLPNFAYNFCAQKIRPRDLAGVDLSSLRAVINCSEPMSWKSHAIFQERFAAYGLRPEALGTCYAMAENVFAVTQGGIEAPVHLDIVDRQMLSQHQIAAPISEADAGESAMRLLSAGPAIEQTQLCIMDQHGHKLPERRIGEIALQSNYMLTGYYHRPDLTQKAFVDGWYLTGDLGYLAGGELYITGRKKDLIIVVEKNIYPQDLEMLASEVEGIHPGRTVAFGVFNQDSGTEDVVLVAEADCDESEFPALENEIRRHVTRGSDVTLRYVKVTPRNWLLKTSSGKIARSANRQKYLEEMEIN